MSGIRRLEELEHRLREEPDNLGLRVMVAGALREDGRRDDAIRLYRSVAVTYRDQGRPQQAIAVCRGVLEFAPDEPSFRELLAALTGQPAPAAAPASLPALSRSQLPPSLQDEIEGYPEIESIANAARMISDALIAASRQDDDDAPPRWPR